MVADAKLKFDPITVWDNGKGWGRRLRLWPRQFTPPAPRSHPKRRRRAARVPRQAEQRAGDSCLNSLNKPFIISKLAA